MKEEKRENLIYKVEDVAELLGIGMNKAYEVMNRSDFPRLNIGRKLIVTKKSFHEWLDNEAIMQSDNNRKGWQ